jgi:hypothetical protein
MVSDVMRDRGRLDILLATPAVNLRKRFLDYTDDELDRVIDLARRVRKTLRTRTLGGARRNSRADRLSCVRRQQLRFAFRSQM